MAHFQLTFVQGVALGPGPLSPHRSLKTRPSPLHRLHTSVSRPPASVPCPGATGSRAGAHALGSNGRTGNCSTG